MCNGIPNCENGEDEDSFEWFALGDELEEEFLQQTQNWSLSNPSKICFKPRQKLTLSTIILAIILLFLIVGLFMVG